MDNYISCSRKIIWCSGMHQFESEIKELLDCDFSNFSLTKSKLSKYRFLVMGAIKGIDKFKEDWKTYFSNFFIVSGLILIASVTFVSVPSNYPISDYSSQYVYSILFAFSIGCHFTTILGCSNAFTVLNLAIRHSDKLRAFHLHGNMVDVAITLSFIFGILSFIFTILDMN